jgi:hypothetical protein
LPSSKRKLRETWWLYEHHATKLITELEDEGRYLLVPRVSKYFTPVLISGRFLPNEKVVCFPGGTEELLGILTSGFHLEWAMAWAGHSKLGPVYDPSRCALTFPRPSTPVGCEAIEQLDQLRSISMRNRGVGLTELYNLLHDPAEQSDDVERLRELHKQLDDDVRDAYGWMDIDLGHGFHATRQGVRYAFDSSVSEAILDRLMDLNHERYTAEVAAGLHAKSKSSTLRRPRGRRAAQTAMFREG